MIALKAAVNKVNSNPKSTWRAKVHEQFVGKTFQEMARLLGRRQYDKHIGPDPSLVSVGGAVANKEKHKQLHEGKQYVTTPDAWDWTAVEKNGQVHNFVGEIRDQGECGSCYAMASISAIESRIRIKSQGAQSPHLSPQAVLSCSRMNQGCEGGYPFLVGKHGMDVGFVDESCAPYTGLDSACHERCERTYSLADYRYVGDYYGGCDEDELKQELFTNGPVVIGFEAPQALFSYDGGVFSEACQVPQESNFNDAVSPWQHTNHAVLLVGYGTENGTPYWKLKNQWGTEWGEHGYFRITRGQNLCGIESMGVAFDVDL
jgi:cathepsin C